MPAATPTVGGGVELEVHRATLFGASAVGISGAMLEPRRLASPTFRHPQTVVAPAPLDVRIDSSDSPGSATRRAG